MEQDLTREYSKRLGTLSGAQLQAALDRFGLGTLLDAAPAPSGLFGQNVFLTGTRGEYVLRGCPLTPWQFAKERFFARLIHERTDVPVPWPFLIDESADLFGWSYTLMPRLPGLQIGDPALRATLTPRDKRDLARAMGENLALLHDLTWTHCGEYDPATGAVEPVGVSFPEWTASRARRWLQRCTAASAATTEADVAWAEDVVAAARDALGVPFEPTFVHSDYKENNAVAERRAGGWRVSGVFDVGGAYFGDGEEDLARPIATYAGEDVALAREFLAGYRLRRALRPGFQGRFPLYMLADRLIIWEYGQRNRVWFSDGVLFQQWAGQFISLGPQLL